jgi:hypothetical protein
VGGDNYIRDILAVINNDEKPIASLQNGQKSASTTLGLVNLIHDFDVRYKKFLENQGYGNQIRLTYRKI